MSEEVTANQVIENRFNNFRRGQSEQPEIDFSTINYNEASYSNYISGGGNSK